MKKQYSIDRTCSEEELTCFDRLFNSIPIDPYLKARFRYKSISRVNVNGVDVNRNSYEPLLILHGKKYTAVKELDVRHYPEIPLNYHNELLNEIINKFMGICGISKEKEVLVQAHRITSSGSQESFPVVEGPHQDGMEYVGIMCISRHNIEGGISQVLTDRENVVFEHILEPGEMLTIDDSEYFHYTTPTKCKNDNEFGYRDILIFSTPSARPSEHV
ncbi:TPA: 2OG-Fe dioxygenase family protein [Vibrio parahaemolyticus]